MKIPPRRPLALLALASGLGACASSTPAKDPASLMREVHARCFGSIYGRDGWPRDYAQALVWCRRSADLGIPSGQTLYAELYYMGHGVERDYAKALQWYRYAADAGHPHAQIMVGVIYLEGQGVAADRETGIAWLRRAAAQGDEDAVKLLAELGAETRPAE